MIGLVPPEHAGARKCGDGGVTAHRADGQPPRVGSVDAHLLYTLCSRAEIIKIRLLSSLMVSSGATRLAAAAASANIAGALGCVKRALRSSLGRKGRDTRIFFLAVGMNEKKGTPKTQ